MITTIPKKTVVERFKVWQKQAQEDSGNAVEFVCTESEMDELCVRIATEHPLSSEQADEIKHVVCIDTDLLESDSRT